MIKVRMESMCPSTWVSHYPVVIKRGEVVVTVVTNFDIHDIACCARTFGLRGFYIITPLESHHQQLVKRIIHHWTEVQGRFTIHEKAILITYSGLSDHRRGGSRNLRSLAEKSERELSQGHWIIPAALPSGRCGNY